MTHQSVLPDTYSTPQVADLAGLSCRQVIYWVSQGWVKPSGRYGVGPGNYWRWTADDLALLRCVAARIAWGLQPDRAFTPDPGPCPPLNRSGSLH